VCFSGYRRGRFLCRFGRFWAISGCVQADSGTEMVTVDTVVGSLTLGLASCPAAAAVAQIVASAFSLSLVEVLSATCRQTGTRRLQLAQGARELQSAQTHDFMYELVANTSNTSFLLQRAADIVSAGSPAHAAFFDAFTAAGVPQPTSVTTGIEPTVNSGVELVLSPTGGFMTPRPMAVLVSAPTSDEKYKLSYRAIAGIIAGSVVVAALCCISFILLHRQQKELFGDVEKGRQEDRAAEKARDCYSI